MILICSNSQGAFVQANQDVQLWLIGPRPYQAPAGEITQFKMEIMNEGRGDVYLIRGEIYIDQDLSNNWRLIQSESLSNFQLSYLTSAIWTFDLSMPSKILAPNATNGVPQIDLLIRVIYANAQEQQVMSNGHFALGVPGASVRQADNSIWFILVGVIVLLTISILTYWKRSNQHRRPIKSKAKE